MGRTLGVNGSRTNLPPVNGRSKGVDPLAGSSDAPYSCDVSLHRWLSRNRTLLALATILVAVTALAAGLFTNAYVGLLHAAFAERSLAYAQAFATASEPWIEQGEIDMLRSAAQLLLAGSAIYVRIETDEGLRIDERSPAALTLDLEEADPITLGSSRIESGGSHLDIVAAFPSGFGMARIGIDRAAVNGQAIGAIAVASGSAFGFDLLVLSILALGLSRRRRTSSWGTAARPEEARPTLVVGRLTVDPNRKTVRFGSHAVRLTPKQYVLLELLAGAPGRVFSEREILETAWPDSPYADSKDIKQYVYLVRKRLAAVDAKARNLIETVPGFGYRLAVESVDRELTES